MAYDEELADRLVASTAAEEAVMGARRMRGWLRVPPDALRTRRQLAPWVRRGVEHARGLPPRGARRPPPSRA